MTLIRSAVTVAALAAIGGCVVTVPPRPTTVYVEPPHAEWHEIPHERPIEPPHHAEEARLNALFLNEGMARIQANCSRYFNQLGRQAQELAQRHHDFQPGARNIPPTAIVLGFNPAALDRSTEAYLFSHDVRAVEMMVMSTLEAQRRAGEHMAQEAFDPARHANFSREQASRFLQDMEYHCQPDGIRAQVLRSVVPPQVLPPIAPALPQPHFQPPPQAELRQTPPLPGAPQPPTAAPGMNHVPAPAAPLNVAPAPAYKASQPLPLVVPPAPLVKPPAPAPAPAPAPVAKPMPTPPAPGIVAPAPKPPAPAPAAPANKPKASEPARAG